VATAEPGVPHAQDRLVGTIGDWLPIAAVALCVVADAVPHGRIEGWDVVAIVTAAVILLTMARQRILAIRERAASLGLVEAERLRAEKDAAEASNKAKSVFLATMSHEIRTPMNAILGNAGLLAEAPLGPAERESVDAIRDAGQELLSVINAVLDFSKIEAERMEIERVGFPPATLVHSVVSLFGVAAREKGLRLGAEVDPAMPVILAGDPHRLRQILSNLVGNAIKFTAEGEVVVRVRVTHRTPEGTVLRFEVADTGTGIEPRDRERLFAAFSQGDASTTRRFGGTGLGLAICKSLVGLMGGEIGVDSTPGEGSTFWFTVLLPSPSDTEAGSVLEANESVARTRVTIGARVLVAEDNAANVRLIVRLLERLGTEVAVVGNGVQAMDAARAGGFDLVLMDCQMPEMDGLAATRAIREEGFLLPIVALTANVLNSDRQACIDAGMNDYLAKPIVTADLEATLRRWLPADAVVGVEASGSSTAGSSIRSVIDQSQLAELIDLDPDGSAGFLAAMADSYRTTVAETMPAIRDAVAGSDWELLEEAAHKLKGVAGNLGVRRVHEGAARLVSMVRAGKPEGAAAVLDALEEALGPSFEALDAVVSGLSGPSEPGTRAA
jgi:signal transduction histidine kinase/DNA-binding NarL/FixJ family response regulator